MIDSEKHLVVLNEFVEFGVRKLTYTCYSCYSPDRRGYPSLTCKRRMDNSRLWRDRIKEFRAAHPFDKPLTYEEYRKIIDP